MKRLSARQVIRFFTGLVSVAVVCFTVICAPEMWLILVGTSLLILAVILVLCSPGIIGGLIACKLMDGRNRSAGDSETGSNEENK